MKTLKILTIVLGLAFILPAAANASPDDFDSVTVEAVELDDNSQDVTHEVEIPDDADRDEHASQEQEEQGEHEDDHSLEDAHEDSVEEDSHDGDVDDSAAES